MLFMLLVSGAAGCIRQPEAEVPAVRQAPPAAEEEIAGEWQAEPEVPE